jgi:DNA polymerase-3 subunit gamma/tau
MKIKDILVENQQLDEGPLDAIGRGVGKLAGGTAKAVGSVAGGVAGLGKAFMKGYRGGKATVAGDDEEGGAPAPAAGAEQPAAGGTAPAAAPAGGGAAPAAGGGAAPKAKAKPQSTFGKLTTAAGGGAEEPASDNAQAAPAAPGAATPNASATPKTTKQKDAELGAVEKDAAQRQQAKDQTQPKDMNDTAYAQAQKAVKSLPPEQQKEIVTMLQADPKVKAAMSKPAAPKSAADKAGAGAFGAMAKQLGGDQPATEPAAPDDTKSSTGGNIEKTAGGVKHTANPNNPNASKPAAPAPAPAAPAAPADEKPGFLKTATDKIKDKAKKPAKPSQAEIDADRERIMGVTSDSIIRKGLMVSESFSFFRKR